MMDDPSKIADQTKGARLHKTNNDIKNNAKVASLEALQARLADGIDLALVTKQAHWNLKGPQFIGVHLMPDGFQDEQGEWNDLMAERIAQLGGTACGTVQEVTRETKLQPYPTDIYAVRQGIDDTDGAADAGTADLLTEVSRGVDKQLWFLEAHTQEPSGTFRT